VYGEVMAVSPTANGKRVVVKLLLENQGARRHNGATVRHEPSGRELEFTDRASTLEFISASGKVFRLVEWNDEGDDDRDDVTSPLTPSPEFVD
jgi:hypothetical protein